LPANQVIYLTEEGWNDVSDVWYGNTEPHLTWTAPSGGLTAGTIVEITETSSNVLSVSSGTVGTFTGSFNLSAGDNVIAYTSSTGIEPASPNFIAALLGDDNFAHTTGCDQSNNWFDCTNCTVSGITCLTTGVATSGLPTGLTDGLTAIALFPSPHTEEDNAKYSGSTTDTTKLGWLNRINNRSNWTFNNSTNLNISPTAYNASGSFTVLASSTPVSSSISSQTNNICNGDALGSLTVTASDGTTPYTYNWSNTATTATISTLGAGTYTVTVTDAGGTTATSSATITEPTALNTTISSQTNVACFGENTGSLTASVTGGTSPYTYNWNSGETSATISGKAAGTYTVSVLDANGCGEGPPP